MSKYWNLWTTKILALHVCVNPLGFTTHEENENVTECTHGVDGTWCLDERFEKVKSWYFYLNYVSSQFAQEGHRHLPLHSKSFSFFVLRKRGALCAYLQWTEGMQLAI